MVHVLLTLCIAADKAQQIYHRCCAPQESSYTLLDALALCVSLPRSADAVL